MSHKQKVSNRKSSSDQNSLMRKSDFKLWLLGTLDEVLSENISIINGEKVCKLKIRFTLRNKKQTAVIWYTISRSSDNRVFEKGDDFGIEYIFFYKDPRNNDELTIERNLIHFKRSKSGKVTKIDNKEFFH